VVERLLELMSLLRYIVKVLDDMARLARSYGVEVYVIGGRVNLADGFECYRDVCIYKEFLRVHADGSVDKVLRDKIVKVSRDEVESVVAHYKERADEVIKSLRELRETLAVIAAELKLAS
jgi:hypothetical protein